MGNLFDDLLSPLAYPEPRPSDIERRDTHVSSVYLTEGDAYKVKKAVNLGFLDFSTPDKRLAACRAEVELNRRISPEIYRGVVPIVRGADGMHRIGADGEVVEHAVHMQRLPDEERADVLLERGALGTAEVDRIATLIARFHASCGSESAAPYGSVEAISHNVKENFSQTRDVLDHYITPAEAAEIEDFQLGVLRDDRALFEARIAGGAIRDGHGDLRLDHVYLRPDGSVTVLDCIEFNDRFRYADVACDLAFLTMDLAHHRRVDLAEHLLASYARETNDFGLYSVVDFYESYRALVRAKIETLLAESRDNSLDLRKHAAEEARRYFLLALSADRTPMLRRVVVAVGGVIAAGKSTLAGWISDQLGAPIVEADRTRKSMLGVSATTRVKDGAFAGAYDKGFTEQVYEELRRRAGVVLKSGRPVILDASFRSPSMRLAARELAHDHGVPFVFVECRAPAEVCKARLVERQERSDAVSDARLAIFDDFVKEWKPVEELSMKQHVIVDTSCSEEQTHREVKAHVATWPAGLLG